jgi:predicted acylesterase/phospholipase RssA/CRP-like cAMP-binding protein
MKVNKQNRSDVSDSKSILEFLENLSPYSAFTNESIPELSQKVNTISLKENETLFSQGEDADSMFILLDGHIQLLIQSPNGRRNTVKELKPGDICSIIPMLTGGRHNASAIALDNSVVAQLKRKDFNKIIENFPDIRANMLEIVSHRMKRSQLAEVLPSYFDEIDEATFDYIESLFQWVHIKRGDILYNKGDVGDSLYILINGLLHVIDKDRSDPHRVLAEIRHGEIVGEMAILSDEIRTASIHAARDCDLVKLSRDSFENISEKFPQVMVAITRVLVDRLKNVRTGRTTKRSSISFTIIPISKDIPINEFCLKLSNAFNKIGTTSLITSDHLDKYLHVRGISKIAFDDLREPRLRTTFTEIETQHDFTIYQAEPLYNTWTQRCLNQADTVVLVGHFESSHQLTELEKQIHGNDYLTTTPRKKLVLLHTTEKPLPSDTSKWLEQRNIRGHHHVRFNRESDFSRLARILCNRAVGLVLGGGAAKGIAHIGVIKALEEMGIPIDMVGGASMGSIIGAHYSMGNNYDSMLQMCRQIFIEINPFKEYTIPIISLMRGKRLERMGKVAYGDTQMEDLWLNYFCVSSNLTTSQVKVHRRGSLWKSVRTSSSIPGVISPVFEKGEVYVDGGVINNLPGDVMRRQCGIVIVVEVSPNLDLTTKVTELPSPWKILLYKLIPFKKKIKIPSIVDIMLSTVLTGSFIAANSVKKDADLSLSPPLQKIGFLDFKKMEQIADIGYNYTKEVLEKPENKELLEKLKSL